MKTRFLLLSLALAIASFAGAQEVPTNQQSGKRPPMKDYKALHEGSRRAHNLKTAQ